MTAHEVARLLAAADAAMAAGQRDTAFAHLEAALNLDPTNPRILNSLGLRALQGGDAVRAVALLERAAAADPEASPLWYNLSTAHRATGDADAELLALEACLTRDPYMLRALLAKGQLLERRGDAAGAVRAYTGLLKASPPDADLPPPLAQAMDHARDYVTAQTQGLADALAPALATARANVMRDPAADPRRFDRAVEVMLGQSRVYRPEPTGLHFPFLPAIEFFDRSSFDWLNRLEAATPLIQAELAALLAAPEADMPANGFAPYVAYAPGTPVNQWHELNHSQRWNIFSLQRDGIADVPNRARCPNTAAMLDSLPLLDVPGRGPSAFFSLLRPHTQIPPHTGATNIRTIVHLPLIVPPGCGFRVGATRRPWIIGEAFAFDDTIEHEAWNDSDELRAVLIFDVWNPCLTLAERDLCRALFAAIDARNGSTAGFEG
jgi:aspartyl/asparaginyl beta-hydroxylase (cupin superfamily)/Flp pilus assembly protein TadD